MGAGTDQRASFLTWRMTMPAHLGRLMSEREQGMSRGLTTAGRHYIRWSICKVIPSRLHVVYRNRKVV